MPVTILVTIFTYKNDKNMNKKLRVCFYLRSNYKTNEGKTPILVRLYLQKERISLGSTSCSVDEKLWDNVKGRVKGRTAEAQQINAQLEHIESDLMYIFRRHEFDDNLSLDLIKSEYLGKEEDKDSFLAFYDEYLKSIREEVGITRAMASVEKFTVMKKRFEAFLKKRYNRKDLLMGEMTYKVISEFEHFLLTDSKCCHNTVMRMMRNFKTVTIRAIKMGVMKQDPFTNYKIRFEKVDRGFVTDEEIQAMMSKEFTIKRLEQVRDIFIFSCFTGLAYIDVAHLQRKHIVTLDGRQWIMTKRQKTDVPTNVLLLDIPRLIIEKYKDTMADDEQERLLPVLSNQKMNAYLKEIADLCGIEKRLSFHLARHTFATMAISKGVPVESVSKMLGHTNIQTTQIYARIINKKVETDMITLSSKLGFDTASL